MKAISLALLAVLALACNKEPSRSQEAAGSAATKTVKDGLEIISEGAQPRKLLRYAVAKGTHSPIEVAMDMDLDAGIKNVAPTLVMVMDIGVDDVTSDGKMKLRTSINDVSARDRPGAASAAMLKGQLDLMTGTTMTATLGPDGSFKDSAFESSKKMPDAMKEQLAGMTGNIERIAMPLPAVPVGVGAKWRATKSVAQNGMNVTTVTTFELTKIDGDVFAYKTTVTITGPDQAVTMGGMTTQVTGITGSGSGEGTMNLAKLAMTSTQDVHFAATMAAGDDKTELKTSLKVVMTPKS
ncbi:MAG TPA: DUF6263 family protein [Kofleriaceae bacterium]|jgi:hypothetical protein|nr:DUF6263 family protein [Kofleriaceae bacterium]